MSATTDGGRHVGHGGGPEERSDRPVVLDEMGLRLEELGALGRDADVLELDAGEVLVHQGDEAHELYVLLAGELEVVVGPDGQEQSVALLGPGATVGEIALLAGDARSATVRARERSRIAVISEEGFRRLVQEHPSTGEALARRAVERLRETQLIGQINQLFGQLDPGAITTVKELISWMPVGAGTRLFSEGDAGDAAYLVVTGRLRAFVAGPGGAEVEVGEIGRGEMVGEMALLEHTPRTATVYAVRDSQLVRFSRSAFEALLERYPSAALLVALTVLRRSHGPTRDSEARRLSLVLVPGSPGVDMERFGRQLTSALGPDAHYVSSDGIDRDLGVPGISQVGPDDVGSIRLGYWLEELQERHRFLVYGIDDDWSPWSRRALRWADHVLVVADAEADPTPGALEQDLWRLVEVQKHPKVSLALIHPPSTALPSGTRRWLEPRPLASHHHVRRDDPESTARLGRLLTGTGTSLVLGGGGARGFAHLGVLVVLEELGLSVDMVGGTSIGSIMAVGPAMGWTAEETRQVATEHFNKIFDYTLPVVSVLKGERISGKLRGLLGDIDIADLWLPYFCVATDLTSACSRYLDRGPLATAVRASIAIPGVLPPVPWEGDLLVDGGILDNVPVDEMRRRNPTGRIIAVDVAPVEGPAASEDFGLSVSGFRALFDRRHDDGPPGLLGTILRSSLIASVRDRDRVVRDQVADLYLDLAVEGGGLLDFSAAQQIATAAESTTRPILRRWQHTAAPEDMRYVATEAAGGPVPAEAPRHGRGAGVLLLTMRDLQHRAVRFGAVVVGTAVVLALLFLMTGLIEQFHREPAQTVDAIGADGWLLRDGVSGPFTSGSTLPADTADALDGVAAAPLVVARHSFADHGEQTDVVVIGYEAGRLGEPPLRRGELPSGPGQALIDDSSGLRPGDRMTLGDHSFTITGNTDHTTMFAGMPLIFMPLADAQALFYRGQPLATAVVVDGRPASVPDGFTLHEPSSVAADGMRPLDGAIASIELIRVLLWFVAAMIIGTMIYLSALERRRDVAVLKAVGGSTGQMAASIALEGALIAAVSAAIAAVLQLAFVPVFPMQVSVPSSAFVSIPLIAVLVALVSGAVGLRKTVRIDPALAFSGPGS